MVFNNHTWTLERLFDHIWREMIDYGRVEWANVSNSKRYSPKVKQKLMEDLLDRRCWFGFIANVLEGQPRWVMTGSRVGFVF